MNEAEIYEFDLNGYIIYRDLIAPADVARMNQLIDADMTRQLGGVPGPVSPLGRLVAGGRRYG